MSIYEIFLKEFHSASAGGGVRDSSCPIEDWDKICAYYSDTDELRKMGLKKVEAWLTDNDDDKALLARWIVG